MRVTPACRLVSFVGMALWYKHYSREQWKVWLEALPTYGEQGWTKQEWQGWFDDLETVEAIVCTKGETDRSPSIVRLRGANAKERSKNRSVLRAHVHKLRKPPVKSVSSDEPPPPICPRVKYISCVEPPPPICDRMGVGWDERGACECRRWPSWVSQNICLLYTSPSPRD